MTTEATLDLKCMYCGGNWHGGTVCPRVSRMEYDVKDPMHPGVVKAIEFHRQDDDGVRSLRAALRVARATLKAARAHKLTDGECDRTLSEIERAIKESGGTL